MHPACIVRQRLQAAVIGFLCVMSGVALGQEGQEHKAGTSQEQKTVTSVTVSDGLNLPKEESFNTVTLEAPPDVKVGAVMLYMQFPTTLVSFVRAGSYLLDAIQGRVEATTKTDPKDDTKSILELKISAPKGTDIPTGGSIAYLVFRVADGVALGTKIPLTSRVVVLTADDPPSIIEPVNITSAVISVGVELINSCFFYMH